MEIVQFGAADIENVFARMTPQELDTLSFGVIQIDELGQILLYNATEGEIAGFDAKAAIGKNFFTEVAPCTDQPGFRGRFDAGVRAGNLNVVFEWHLVSNYAPTVQVHMKQAVCGKKFWVFTKRL